jgi:hemerythrin-like domain-containing protein
VIDATSASRPTAYLSREHELILRVLSVLERILDEGDEVGRIHGADGAEVLDFLRTFADRCHHAKEEDLLFPRLQARGWPGEQGPAAVLVMDHHEERAHLRGLALQLGAAARGDVEALAAFSSLARCYVALVRDHLAHEDREVFPLAERLLDRREKEELARAFEEADLVQHPCTHERMVESARCLCDKYGVGKEPAVAGTLAEGHEERGP